MKTAIISGPHFVTEALFGIGLSYGLTSGIENVKDLERAECYDRLMQIARGLQSESTIHTITKRPLTEDDFEMPNMPQKVLDILDSLRGDYLRAEKRGDKEKRESVFRTIKALLPEGFLQRRIVCLNAKALQNMYTQRKNHRLPEWRSFFDAIKEQKPKNADAWKVAPGMNWRKA